MSAPPMPTDGEVSTAYHRALAYAQRHSGGRPPESVEALRDAATDAVVWATKHYDPSRTTKGFAGFCAAAVGTWVARARRKIAEKRRLAPRVGSLPDDIPARTLPSAGEAPMTSELNDLPDELREAVRLVFVDGCTYQEAGAALGVSAKAIHSRLRRAAHMLVADGVTAPTRRPKEKRVRGGKGH